MNKRVLQETSPVQTREESVGIYLHICITPSEQAKPTMEPSSTITVEILKEILDTNTEKLVKELPFKADFQVLRAELTGLKVKYEEISAKVIQLERWNNILEDQVDKLLGKFKGIIREYELKWIPAVKINTFGRGRGELLGYRKCLEGVVMNFKLVEERDILEVKVMGSVLFIVPIYLNYNHWNRDYDKLCGTLQDLGSMDILLVGDFNAVAK